MKILLQAMMLVLCVSIFISCKKTEITTVSLPGKWELRKSEGGVGGINTTYLAGNGNTINFTANNFEFSDNGVVTYTGAYSIEKDNTQTDPDLYILYLDHEKYLLRLQTGRIVIWNEGTDVLYNTYDRIQ